MLNKHLPPDLLARPLRFLLFPNRTCVFTRGQWLDLNHLSIPGTGQRACPWISCSGDLPAPDPVLAVPCTCCSLYWNGPAPQSQSWLPLPLWLLFQCHWLSVAQADTIPFKMRLLPSRPSPASVHSTAPLVTACLSPLDLSFLYRKLSLISAPGGRGLWSVLLMAVSSVPRAVPGRHTAGPQYNLTEQLNDRTPATTWRGAAQHPYPCIPCCISELSSLPLHC